MLVKGNSSASMLYDVIRELGLTCSEEKHIRMVREEANTDQYFTTESLSIADIDRVGYLNPHIEVDRTYGDNIEIWVNNVYQHPDKIKVIEGNPKNYVVLCDTYDPATTTASVFYNPSVLYRYHKIVENPKSTGYKHSITIDIRNAPYNRLEYPDRCAYYIADNQVKIPTVKWLDDYQIQFEAIYTSNIDFFLVSNLVGVFEAKKNVGIYIDAPNSPVCYHHIIINGDPSYPIDARFYPCIKVDKNCMIRVFNDHFHRLKYPETCRLVLYPEYADVVDPYNTNVEYLRTLKEIDDVIYKTDSNETIYRKFLRIARFCYRVWEKFPKFDDEVSDFIICDNHKFGVTHFRTGYIAGAAEAFVAIYSVAPFEAHRDLLFYDGMLFSDYSVMRLAESNGKLIESVTGSYRYIIRGDYDIDKFTLIKFNSWEDTNVFNVGDYIDPTLTLQLHTKLNQFYRNLVVVRKQLLTQPEDDYVRVMTEAPSIRDEHLWFELLVNANPTDFEQSTDLIINLYGVNGELIPDTVKKGAYMLNMDPENGPANYTDILMTFFELSEKERKYLALQYDERDSKVGVYYDLTVGDADHADGRVDGGLVLDDSGVAPPYKEGTIDIGTSDTPDSGNFVPGDLYAEVEEIGDLSVDNMMSLDDLADLEFLETSKDNFSSYSRQTKIDYIKQNLSALDPDEQGQIGEQLLDAPSELLDQICYKIKQTEYVYQVGNSGDQSDTSSVSGVLLEDMDLGEVVQHNLKYIISEDEPTEKQINDLWIQIPDVDMRQYIKDIVSYELKEYLPKKPTFNDTVDPNTASFAIDYGANDTSGLTGELFQAEKDPTLRKVHVGTTPPTVEQMETDADIWYEYLGETVDRVCYYDAETMIIMVNERLMAVQFGHDNITGFLFDDVVLNFRGKLGIKYLSILADLVNAGVIKQSDMNIFYRRLITEKDEFNPGLDRLYTGTSHVVATCKVDTTDLAVLYSSNIGRFTMNYADESTTNREREAAYRMCIDYSGRSFAYLTDRMLVFVNGKYIPREQLREEIAQNLQLLNFNEVISTVDILYSKKDIELMKVKKNAYAYWPLANDSVSIQRPERDYQTMEPIQSYDRTKRGYYDILLDEFIFNGKLQRILSYLQDHPEEAERFKNEIVNQFHAISDLDNAMIPEGEHPRIIISGSGNDPVYTIQESNE